MASIWHFSGEPQDLALKWRRIAECRRVLGGDARPSGSARHPETPEIWLQHNCSLLRASAQPGILLVLEDAWAAEAVGQ